MPLPDATKDQRIYQLLKNIDLGNLTFSEFQTAAQSVFAEPEAEDTLRRIVLVNLARMSVAGDWAGLTSAGGGGGSGSATAIVETFTGSTGALVYRIPAQAIGPLQANWNPGVGMYMVPFVGTDDAVIDAMQINTTSTNGTTTLAGVYSATAAGLPDQKLTEASFTTDTTGLITQTSLTGTFTMEKGGNYWLAWIIDHAAQQYKCIRYSTTTPTSPFPALNCTQASYTAAQLFDASITTLPTSPTMSGFEPDMGGDRSIPMIGLRLS